MTPDWKRCADEMPPDSGHYLVYFEREADMGIAAYNDRGGHDTWGEPRKLGWVAYPKDKPNLWPTHWADRPAPPVS